MEKKNKTLKDFFIERENEYPELGSYINLCYTIHYSGANRQEITKAFNELIPKDEYDKGEKKELIDYLVLKAKDEEPKIVRHYSTPTSGRILVT